MLCIIRPFVGAIGKNGCIAGHTDLFATVDVLEAVFRKSAVERFPRPRVPADNRGRLEAEGRQGTAGARENVEGVAWGCTELNN